MSTAEITTLLSAFSVLLSILHGFVTEYGRRMIDMEKAKSENKRWEQMFTLATYSLLKENANTSSFEQEISSQPQDQEKANTHSTNKILNAIKFLTLALIIVAISVIVLSQDRVSKLPVASSETNSVLISKIKLYNERSLEYLDVSPDSALYFGTVALELAKIYGKETQLIASYSKISKVHYQLGNLVISSHYLDSALSLNHTKIKEAE